MNLQMKSTKTTTKTVLKHRKVEAADLKKGQQFRIRARNGELVDPDTPRMVTGPDLYVYVRADGAVDTMPLCCWGGSFEILTREGWVDTIEDEAHEEVEVPLTFADLPVGAVFEVGDGDIRRIGIKVRPTRAVWRGTGQDVLSAVSDVQSMPAHINVTDTGLRF